MTISHHAHAAPQTQTATEKATAQWLDGFKRAYPGKPVEAYATKTGAVVSIDQEPGVRMPLSDLQFAIRGFNGHYHPTV
jgi:hypothetical protein